MKTFQIEALIALIIKTAFIFEWNLLSNQKRLSKSPTIWFSNSIFSISDIIQIFPNFGWSILIRNSFLLLPFFVTLVFQKFLQKLAIFDCYFWPIQSHVKINTVFAIRTSIWNVFYQILLTWLLLSTLLNQFKLVARPLGQSNMRSTLDFCPDQTSQDSNVPKLKVSKSRKQTYIYSILSVFSSFFGRI